MACRIQNLLGESEALRHVDVTLASNLLHGVREKLLATPPNGVKFDTVDLQQTFREPQSVGKKGDIHRVLVVTIASSRASSN